MFEVKRIAREEAKRLDREWRGFDEEIGIRWDKKKAALGAYANGKLAGCAVLTLAGGVGHIHRLMVAKPFRGKGAGKALLEKAERVCRDGGCHKITLKTSERHGSLGFYKRLGYCVEAELRNDRFKLTWYLLCKGLQ